MRENEAPGEGMEESDDTAGEGSSIGRIAVCCSVLQCVAVCCSVLQCGAARCRVLQCVAVRAQRTQENEAQSRGLIAEGPPAHELRFKLLLHIIFTKLIETQQR